MGVRFVSMGGGGVAKRGARITNSVNQSILNGTLTAISFDTVRWDYGAFFSSTNPTRLTIPQAGIYLVVANIRWPVNATGVRTLHCRINGTNTIAGDSVNGVTGDPTRNIVASIWEFSANDYVEALAYQESTIAINVEKEANDSPEFMIQLMA